MLALFICKPQVYTFPVNPIIIKDLVNNTLKSSFSGFFYYTTIVKMAEYRSSTFTGVKFDASSTQPFVIILAGTGFTSTGVVGSSCLPFVIIPVSTGFTSTGVVGSSCSPAIILAGIGFTSTGVVGSSCLSAIINGRRSPRGAFTGVKLLGFSAPVENYSGKTYE